MRHDPNNSQCDKTQYGDAPDVRCTCDIDDPSDAPVPSTIIRESGAPALGQFPIPGLTTPAAHPGVVTLTGRQAATHRELAEAGRDFQAARVAFERAQARYKAAVDAHMQEIVP